MRRNYSPGEVRGLVERYEELAAAKGVHGYSLLILCKLADLEKALSRLSIPEREAVLLVGKAGLTVRTAGVLLGVSGMTMNRRFSFAMGRLTTYMNGE